MAPGKPKRLSALPGCLSAWYAQRRMTAFFGSGQSARATGENSANALRVISPSHLIHDNVSALGPATRLAMDVNALQCRLQDGRVAMDEFESGPFGERFKRGRSLHFWRRAMHIIGRSAVRGA